MTLPIGFNFRAELSYATDGPGEYAELFDNGGRGVVYPHTEAGIAHGWEGRADVGWTRDRSTGIDRRLCGLHYSVAIGNTYRVDLPNGNYNLRIAVGESIAAGNAYWDIKDGTTTFKTLAATTTPGSFLDANGVEHTKANWPANNTPLAFTITTGILRVVATTSNSHIQHIYIEEAASGATATLTTTLDPAIFSGTASASPVASLSVSTAGAIFSGSASVSSDGVLTLPALKNNTGTLLASETGATVHVYATSGAHIVTKTGQTTNGSGVMSITDPLIVASTQYRVVVVLASGAEGMDKVTAA